MSPNDREILSDHERSSLMIVNRDATVTRMDDNETLFEMFSQWYLEENPGRIAEIAKAIDQDEAKEVEIVAHTMKGGAATLGAERVSDVACRLELAGRDGDLSQASGLLAEPEQEVSTLCDYLERLPR